MTAASDDGALAAGNDDQALGLEEGDGAMSSPDGDGVRYCELSDRRQLVTGPEFAGANLIA